MKFPLLMVLFFTTLFSSGEACGKKKKEIITWRCSNDEGGTNYYKTDECCERIKGELDKDGMNCNEELKGMLGKPKREISKKRRERVLEAMECCNPPGTGKKIPRIKVITTSIHPTAVQPAVQPIIVQLTVVQSAVQPTAVANSTTASSTTVNSTMTTSTRASSIPTASSTTVNSTPTTRSTTTRSTTAWNIPAK